MYTRIFFKEWQRICHNRMRTSAYVRSNNLIQMRKKRAFGRAQALIEELNGVTERIVDRCNKLQTADEHSKHILRWSERRVICLCEERHTHTNAGWRTCARETSCTHARSWKRSLISTDIQVCNEWERNRRLPHAEVCP